MTGESTIRGDTEGDSDTADGETAGIDTADDDAPARPVEMHSAEELDAFLADHEIVLVEFHTEGCTLCESIQPVLGAVARAADVPVATINPRDDPELIERFTIASVPTLLVVVDGEPVDRLAEGFVGADRILEFLATHAPDRVPKER
jgi:thiol-disulfide isomerase/thioredoxin